MADLTPEQNARVKEISDKYIAIGQSSGPTDREACEKAVVLAYQTAKLPLPTDEDGKLCIMWVTNPKLGMDKAAKFVILDRYLERGGFNWSDKKPPQVAHLDLRRQVDEVFPLLGLAEPTREQRNEQRQTACYGQHDVYWCAFYSAMEYLQPDALNRDKETGQCVLDGLIEMTKCGWWWPFNHGVILCDRPTEAHFDERGRPSNRNGPALAFPDGYSLYLINGIQLDEKIIKRQFGPADIQAQRNAEIRRIMVELYGEAKFLKDLGAAPIHEDECGQLFRVEQPGDEPLVMVRVVDATPHADGTREVYFLRVDPELRPMVGGQRLGTAQAMTARNAVASLAGLTGDQYHPQIET